MQRTRAALAARACGVWLLNHDGAAELKAATGLSEPYLRWLRTLPRPRLDVTADAEMLAGRPSFNPDIPASFRGQDPGWAAWIAAEGVTSALRLPVRLPGGVVSGWLNVMHSERHYEESEVRLAQASADQIAVALHNAQLAEQEREARQAAARQLERMTLLAEITRQLLAATELETVLRIVTESAWRLCDARTATIMLADADGGGLTLQALGTENDALRGGRVLGTRLTPASFAGTPFDRALRERSAIVTEDLCRLPPSPPRDRGLEFGLLSGVTAPLLVEGRALGVLNVAGTRVRTFTSEDIALVQALADQAALAIEHARLTRRSQDAAVLEERSRLARDLHDEESLFRIAQECLNNVAKHARASHVDIHLTIDGSIVELTVADDGAGFEPASPSEGRRSLGMTSMRERAMLLGGTCTVDTAPGAGTRITARLPLAATEAVR